MSTLFLGARFVLSTLFTLLSEFFSSISFQVINQINFLGLLKISYDFLMLFLSFIIPHHLFSLFSSYSFFKTKKYINKYNNIFFYLIKIFSHFITFPSLPFIILHSIIILRLSLPSHSDIFISPARPPAQLERLGLWLPRDTARRKPSVYLYSFSAAQPLTPVDLSLTNTGASPALCSHPC